jgi:hypothetical protein
MGHGIVFVVIVAIGFITQLGPYTPVGDGGRIVVGLVVIDDLTVSGVVVVVVVVIVVIVHAHDALGKRIFVVVIPRSQLKRTVSSSVAAEAASSGFRVLLVDPSDCTTAKRKSERKKRNKI